jgi:hypothetical protein
MAKIIDLTASRYFGKRYQATVEFPDGKQQKYQFGQDLAFTYVDGAPERTKEAYLARHMANPRENFLIMNLIPSPALFSMRLLWGDSRNLITNLDNLNRDLRRKG